MIAARRIAVAGAVIFTLSLTACGGGDDGGATIETKVPAAVLARANAICRDFKRETEQLGQGALANPPDTTLELTTERLVKPSIPLLESAARRMQALEPAADNSLFSLYAHLFDPAVVLAQKRLEAGRAENAFAAKRVEDALSNLALEQRRAARIVGLDDCDVDFQAVLLASLSE